jgi:hypothetical protein
MRQFNVFSPFLVVVPNEAFEWVLDSAEASSVIVRPVSTWPLTESQYTVTAGTPEPASVSNSATGGIYPFACTPPAPNVTEQRLAVAARNFVDVCGSFSIMPGEYFIWRNDTVNAVTIAPDPNNDDFWPLPGQSYTIQAHGHVALQIDPEAETEKEYVLVVTFEGGGGCTEASQPKLIVGSSGL